MPMPPYIVRCYKPGCDREASYKIAARWSDGQIGELKTYFLSCPDCLKELYRTACAKKAACRLAPGETLSDPQIFDMARGHRDRDLLRREDLEQPLPAHQ